MEQIPDGAIRVDPARAFGALQEKAAQEIARLIGDNAAKDAYIGQLQDELTAMREALEAKAEGNGKVPETTKVT